MSGYLRGKAAKARKADALAGAAARARIHVAKLTKDSWGRIASHDKPRGRRRGKPNAAFIAARKATINPLAASGAGVRGVGR